MKIIRWLVCVEVASKKEAEKVIEVAKEYGACYKKGKPHGKPGAIKCRVYVEAKPFSKIWHYDERQTLRNVMSQRVPNAEVLFYDSLEFVEEI